MVHTILLVEDETSYRNAVKRVLEDPAYQFLEADNGKHALNVLESNSAVDLILLDLLMPSLDGFSFLRKFRRNPEWRTIPVCVMTAWSDSANRRDAAELGADDFVGKPVDNIELQTRVKSLLRISQYQKQLRELNTELEAKVLERTRHLQATLEKLEEAWEQSSRDALTGAFNRRFMWDWLVPQLKQAQRHKAPFACLMLDIDRFKNLNDSHGHDVGDQVLKDFTRIVAETLRTSDIIVRYGGEEFLALLPQCTLEGAHIVAERIREAVLAAQMSSVDKGQVTCSIGVAFYDPEQPQTAAELLKQADRALYEAKNAGRNRVA